ncbi:unnamed protein product [Ostreobium quekettii]|uniref:CENP-V/GFA domain-containing protein n=1 Tax=Ostreobium quekettii TaxID=121088 RepID=A0A8S1JC23_9CHLO|nr:unnamed protein product [Ostreobium quekettii]
MSHIRGGARCPPAECLRSTCCSPRSDRAMAATAGTEGQGGADSGEAPAYKGSCFCGKVKIDIKGPVASSYACHCTVCQRLHGAPFSIHVNFARGSIVPTPESQVFLAGFDSSEKVVRYHCKVCASRVYNDIAVEGFEFVDAPVTIFERGSDGRVLAWDAVKPKCHIFYSTRVEDASDKLPKFDALMPGCEAYDPGKLHQPST